MHLSTERVEEPRELPPLPMLATVVMRYSGPSSPVPRGRRGVHLDRCDQDERTLVVVTLKRGDLLLLPDWN